MSLSLSGSGHPCGGVDDRARTVAPSALVNFRAAATPIARVRLDAFMAEASQSALAWNFEGRCAKGPDLRSALTCSTIA